MFAAKPIIISDCNYRGDKRAQCVLSTGACHVETAHICYEAVRLIHRRVYRFSGGDFDSVAHENIQHIRYVYCY